MLGNAAARGAPGNAEHIARVDHARIANLRVGGDESIEGNPKTLGKIVHRITGNNSVATPKSRRTMLGNATARGFPGNAEHVARVDHARIANLWIRPDKSIKGDPKTLGKIVHRITGNNSVATPKSRRTVLRITTASLAGPVETAGAAVMSDHRANPLSRLIE